MSDDLYTVLGLPRGASQQDIRSAYRRLAKTTHPDAPGGSKERFLAVGRAKKVLSDPDMRACYDATGSVDEERLERAEDLFKKELIQAFKEIVSVTKDIDTADIIGMMKDAVLESKLRCENSAARARRSIEAVERLMARITKKGAGENIFAQVLREKATQDRAALEQEEFKSRVLALCEEELAMYESPVAMMQDMGWMFGQTPTTTTSFGSLTSFRFT